MLHSAKRVRFYGEHPVFTDSIGISDALEGLLRSIDAKSTSDDVRRTMIDIESCEELLADFRDMLLLLRRKFGNFDLTIAKYISDKTLITNPCFHLILS